MARQGAPAWLRWKEDERAEIRITNPDVVVMPLSRKGSIRLDPDIQKTVQSLIEQLAPTVGAAFDKHFIPYAKLTYRTWPVGPDRRNMPHSRDILEVEYDVRGGGDEIVAFIESPAEYTRYIHKGKIVRRLFDEGMAAANAIVEELERGLV